MKQRFKEKCDICGKSSYFYRGYETQIICDSCMGIKEDEEKEEVKKVVHKAKQQQTNIFDFI